MKKLLALLLLASPLWAQTVFTTKQGGTGTGTVFTSIAHTDSIGATRYFGLGLGALALTPTAQFVVSPRIDTGSPTFMNVAIFTTHDAVTNRILFGRAGSIANDHTYRLEWGDVNNLFTFYPADASHGATYGGLSMQRSGANNIAVGVQSDLTSVGCGGGLAASPLNVGQNCPFTVAADGNITRIHGMDITTWPTSLVGIGVKCLATGSGAGNEGNLQWYGCGTGSGSVTSVAMTVPTGFSISGSPITSSGTLGLTLSNENANLIFAGPTTGSPAAPTFRSMVAADIPTTTVSAASYGDGTHVATFTVDAAGRLTAAAAVSITGVPASVANALATTGASVDVSAAAPPTTNQQLIATDATHATWQTNMGGGLQTIKQIVTAAAQTTVDFTSIPTGYQDLVIVYQGRSAKSAVSTDVLYMEVNADATSGDYTSVQAAQAHATSWDVFTNAPATTYGAQLTSLPAATATANFGGSGTITIPNYLGTTYFKDFYFDTMFPVASVNYRLVGQGVWKSTAAITRLTLTFQGTAFVNGSVFTLYGTPATAVTSLAGAFTNGSVLFSTGNIAAQDNSNFFWDATNHRLGIGTAAPGNTVSMKNAGYYAWRNAANSSETVGVTSSASDDLQFYVNATRLTLTNTGMVQMAATSYKSGAGIVLTLANGDNNNVAPTGNWMYINGPTGAFAITGFAAGTDGQEITIVNLVAQTWTVKYNSGSSTAGNKILFGAAADTAIGAGYSSATFKYSSAVPDWIMIAHD